jgi:hypothetical protein
VLGSATIHDDTSAASATSAAGSGIRGRTGEDTLGVDMWVGSTLGARGDCITVGCLAVGVRTCEIHTATHTVKQYGWRGVAVTAAVVGSRTAPFGKCVSVVGKRGLAAGGLRAANPGGR